MYSKLDQYFALVPEDRVLFLRENGYCYNIEQTEFPPERLLADYKLRPSAIVPNLSIAQAQSTNANKKVMFVYSLYMPQSVRLAYAKAKYISDLNHIKVDFNGGKVSFYDVYINGIIQANQTIKKKFGDDAKVRVYCSMELYFLTGLFKQHDIEVYYMREFPETYNLERADYWKFLAFGDTFHADYTICLNAYDDPLKHADFFEQAMENKIALFNVLEPQKIHNNIDGVIFTATYIKSSYFGVDNRADFFKRYKMVDILSAYHNLTKMDENDETDTGYKGIDLYPEFAYLMKPAINLDALNLNHRCLTEVGGDQCFLNSVLFFGILESGAPYRLAYTGVEPSEKLYVHKEFDFNLIRYLDGKPNAQVVYI